MRIKKKINLMKKMFYIITAFVGLVIVSTIILVEKHSSADLLSKEMEVVEQQVLRQSVASWKWGMLFSGWVNCLDAQNSSIDDNKSLLPIFEKYPDPILDHVRYCVRIGKNMEISEIFTVSNRKIEDEKEIEQIAEYLQQDGRVEEAVFDVSKRHSLRFVSLPNGQTYLALFGCWEYDKLKSMTREERRKDLAEKPLGFLFLIDVKCKTWSKSAKTDSSSVLDVLYYSESNREIFENVVRNGAFVKSSVMNYFLYIQNDEVEKYAYIVFNNIDDKPAICYKVKFSEEELLQENQRKNYRSIIFSVLLLVFCAMLYLAWSHNKQRGFYERQLEYMSFHDKLTDVYNRSYGDLMLRDIEKVNDFPTAIVVIDVNGLKLVNDTLGHTAGDTLLKNVVDVLKRAVGENSYIFRTGGDEFMLLLLGKSLLEAERLVEKIKISMKKFNNDNKSEFPLSMSFGCAVWNSSAEKIEDVFNLADERMYREKQTQRDEVRILMVENLLNRIDTNGIIPDRHEERLAQWINKLSEKLLFTETEKNNMLLLARYHNIGKVGVEENLLHQKESLDESELAKRRNYVIKGCEIAKQCAMLNDIAKMILCQNESWDGTGYPLKIAGKEIPKESRVISILNSFDIMTCGVCYQENQTVENAKKELLALSGKRYDPEIVKGFLEIL